MIKNNRDRWIELAIFNYSISIHEVTEFIPYELEFNKIARMPSNELLGSEDKVGKL